MKNEKSEKTEKFPKGLETHFRCVAVLTINFLVKSGQNFISIFDKIIVLYSGLAVELIMHYKMTS